MATKKTATAKNAPLDGYEKTSVTTDISYCFPIVFPVGECYIVGVAYGLHRKKINRRRGYEVAF